MNCPKWSGRLTKYPSHLILRYCLDGAPHDRLTIVCREGHSRRCRITGGNVRGHPC